MFRLRTCIHQPLLLSWRSATLPNVWKVIVFLSGKLAEESDG